MFYCHSFVRFSGALQEKMTINLRPFGLDTFSKADRTFGGHRFSSNFGRVGCGRFFFKPLGCFCCSKLFWGEKESRFFFFDIYVSTFLEPRFLHLYG